MLSAPSPFALVVTCLGILIVVSSPGALVDSSPHTLVDSAGDLVEGTLIN
jgi:hypothetical protein